MTSLPVASTVVCVSLQLRVGPTPAVRERLSVRYMCVCVCPAVCCVYRQVLHIIWTTFARWAQYTCDIILTDQMLALTLA